MAKESSAGYFSLSTRLFEDQAFLAVKNEFGIKGEMTVIKLLCEIARKGYYTEWSEEVRQRLLGMLPGVTLNLLNMIVGVLVRRGFFDKSVLDSHGILTSSAIQKSFLSSPERDRILPYLLVNLTVSDNSLPSDCETQPR